MGEGRWRDARRMKAQRQKAWEQIYTQDDDKDGEKKQGRKSS
jgi:hypothetical protein